MVAAEPDAHADLGRRKASLRIDLVSRIRSLTTSYRRQAEARIAETTRGAVHYEQARQILAYVALSDEVATQGLLQAAATEGKAVFLPRSSDAPAGIEFAACENGVLPQRQEGPWGVPQPPPGTAPSAVLSLLLIPGRGFDRRGGRLGRGGGHYDRLLPQLRPLGPCVGLAYDCQLVDAVPCEDHDQRMDFLLTESGLIRCSQVG